MDGDNKTTLTTELKWTYLDEPQLKQEMLSNNGPAHV